MENNVLLPWKGKVLIILCWKNTYLNTDVEMDTIFILNYPRQRTCEEDSYLSNHIYHVNNSGKGYCQLHLYDTKCMHFTIL